MFVELRPNSITLSWSQTGSKLVADLQRAGIWPIIYLASSELARVSMSATSFEPVCDQGSVMEFGLDQLRTGHATRFEQVRAISTCRDSSDLLEARRRPVRSWSQIC